MEDDLKTQKQASGAGESYHTAWRADAESSPVSLTPLTGRDTEVALLRDRWEQAKEGMGQVVLVVGEPGLGKSRLVYSIKQIVLKHRSGDASAPEREDVPVGERSTVVEWRCSPRFQNTGLFAASDHLRRFLGFGADESATTQFDRLALHLDEFGLGRKETVALFANLLFLPPDERYPAARLTPIREREETFRALRQWLKACSEREPLLFVIEDLHWIDASTLEFLGQFIAEGLHNRILTVLTFRPEFQTPWPAVAHQTSLALNRLTRRQVAELMRKHAGSSLPESLVTQILERTRGVPLLVEEFSRIIRESLELEPGEVGNSGANARSRDIPATLQELMMARLDRMSSNREVVQLAATLGHEFQYDLLAAVVTTDEPALMAELQKLVDAEILYVKGRPPQCAYAFKHALLEEALRGAAGEEERRRFHQRVAEAMEARFPKVAARQPELLAQHFTEAGLGGKAVAYWLKAALRSQEKFANVEAIAHLTKGLALLDTMEPSPERDTCELEMLGPLGTAYIATRGYAAPEVGPVFDRARSLCERVGQTPQLFTMMWGNFAFHVVRGDFRLCADLADEAIKFGERMSDLGILMEGYFLRGLTMLYRGNFFEARECCARSIDDYDDRSRTAFWATFIGEDAGVTARCYLALAIWHLGFPDGAQRLGSETLALAREIHHPFSLEYALHHAAWLRHDCRLGALAQAAGEEQIRIADEQGYPFWRATGTLYRAAGLVLQGRLEEGLPLLQSGLEAYRATGGELALPYYLGMLADALTQSGRFSEAHRTLREALAIAEKNDEHFQEAELLRLRGELLLADSGDEAAAENSFHRAIATARSQRSRAWELRATTSLARLWQRQNRCQEAFDALTRVYDVFTEGFHTPDLLEAASLLKDLSHERMRGEFAAGAKYVRDCIPPPMRGKVAVDWRYIPSSTLGGDTIGYHWIDDDHLALYLIDVTGHGLDSALLSVSLSNVIRSGSLAAADMRHPDQVLATLNDTFQGRQHSGKFFTIWYGVYQSSVRILRWSGGGHHASVLFAPERPEPLLLPSEGLMMGVIPRAKFLAASCAVPPGARLLIFSDGVFEIRRDKCAVWNLQACISHLADLNQRADAGALMDELLERVRHLRGSQQLDDDFSVIEAHFV
jgi:serine phosphatase RsbU (regulator of sigma subunit)